MYFKSVVFIVAVLLLPFAPVQAGDYYVDGTSGADSPGRGTRAEPWASINYALDHVIGSASSPHRVLVAGGIYRENVVCDPYESIHGGYDPASWARDISVFETTLDGGKSSSVVVLADSSAVDGFTLTNGERDFGGAVYCSNIAATISNCRISLNEATGWDGGSAIYVTGGFVRIINNSILQNRNTAIRIESGTASLENNVIAETMKGSGYMTRGFGIYATDATVALKNDRILRGAADGLYISSSSFEAVDCVIGDNKGNGVTLVGATWADATAILTGCVISGNGELAGNGGGLAAGGKSVTIKQCIFSQNTSPYRGGAISGGSSDTVVLNSIFTANRSLWNHGCYFSGGATTLKNNFLVNNAPILFNDAASGGFPLVSINNSVLYNDAGYQMGFGVQDDAITLINDLFWGNGDDLDLLNDNQNVSFCNISNGDFNGQNNNISVIPDFVGESARGIIQGLVYDAERCESVITDLDGAFPVSELNRCFLWVNETAFYIQHNTSQEITVYGDVRKAASIGAEFTVADYHLMQGSMCIDAGTASGALDHDFEGDRRPLNGGRGLLIDIGADEFDPEGSPSTPPPAPEITGTLAVALTIPSIDPDGEPVSYIVEWQSSTGDLVIHNGCVSVRGILCDVLTETNLLQPNQTWTVTVTPKDISQDGNATVITLSSPNGS